MVRKQPNVLLGWIGGREAKMIESVDIEIISSVCTKLLRKFLNSPDIPAPLKIFRYLFFYVFIFHFQNSFFLLFFFFCIS